MSRRRRYLSQGRGAAAGSAARAVLGLGLLALVWALASACGGPRYPSDFTVQGAHGLDVQPGPAAEEARTLLVELSAELRRHAQSPDGAVDAFEAWLQERAPVMRENALALRAEVDALDGDRLAAWELRFAEFLEEAHAEWLAAREALVRAHPETAREILRMLPELPARDADEGDEGDES